MEMIERRIRDGSVLQLIRKCIQVGVIDEGRLLVSETGTGQGQTISPLLANIYLHYVLDEWIENEVKPRLRGAAHEIRFADDAVLSFQYKEDAERVMEVIPKRFAKYGLTLHPEKTRLVEFGRYAEANAKRALCAVPHLPCPRVNRTVVRMGQNRPGVVPERQVTSDDFARPTRRRRGVLHRVRDKRRL